MEIELSEIQKKVLSWVPDDRWVTKNDLLHDGTVKDATIIYSLDSLSEKKLLGKTLKSPGKGKRPLRYFKKLVEGEGEGISTPPNNTSLDGEVEKLLSDSGITTNEMAFSIKRPISTVRSALYRLEERGLAYRDKTRKIWFKSPNGIMGKTSQPKHKTKSEVKSHTNLDLYGLIVDFLSQKEITLSLTFK